MIRRTPLKRTPLRRTSSKRRRGHRAWKRIVDQRLIETGGGCEIGTPDCTGAANQGHHRKLLSQGGANVPENCLATCPACHSWVHANPAEAYRRGWMLRRESK